MAKCLRCHELMQRKGICMACKLGKPKTKKQLKEEKAEVGPNGNYIVGCIK